MAVPNAIQLENAATLLPKKPSEATSENTVASVAAPTPTGLRSKR